MTFTTSEGTIRIEFRHVVRASKLGRKKLAYTKGFGGMTTCVIVADKFVSIGQVFCSDKDQYSKEVGRTASLIEAINSCKPLRRIAVDILAAYRNRNNTGGSAVAKPDATVQAVYDMGEIAKKSIFSS
jgi:hypothetical protein